MNRQQASNSRYSFAFWLVTLAACVAAMSTAALGSWQLSRAAYKEALSADMQAKASAAPLTDAALAAVLDPSVASDTAAAYFYRKARLQGHWLAEQTVFLDNRQMDGQQGFLVVTPLQLVDNGHPVVLVQRGWAPRHYAQRTELPSVTTDAGLVDIVGHVAGAPGRTFALGSDQHSLGFNRIRQNLDLDAFREETGLPLAAVTFVQQGADSNGLKRHWAEVTTGVEKHYGYAFQWFALCALILGLYVWFQFVRPRQRT